MPLGNLPRAVPAVSLGTGSSPLVSSSLSGGSQMMAAQPISPGISWVVPAALFFCSGLGTCYVAVITSLERKLNIRQRDLHVDLELKKKKNTTNEIDKNGFGDPFSLSLSMSLPLLCCAVLMVVSKGTLHFCYDRHSSLGSFLKSDKTPTEAAPELFL